MSKCNNITGKRFGKLVAIEKIGKDIHRQSIWKCICDCGNEIDVILCSLTTGNTHSCGCIRANHGFSRKERKRREFHIWRGMIERTSNPNNKDFENYGNRGITVCNEWLESFKTFWHDMKGSYNANLTIDRIDNNKGYSKDNCRWTTSKVQSNNRRNNVFLNFNNENHTIAQWSDIVGINSETIRSRINRGWSVNKALTMPVRIKLTIEGVI